MNQNLDMGASAKSSLVASVGAHEDIKIRTTWRVECRGADGKVKWSEEFHNLVMTEGKNDLLTQYFKGSAYTATWFVALVNNAGFSTYAVGDTAAQIGGTNGWAESTAYTQGTRPAWTGGSVAGGSVDDTASPAVFTINATVTIRGAFLISNSTKAGTTGKLYCGVDFSTARSLVNTDTLNVTVTLTAS